MKTNFILCCLAGILLNNVTVQGQTKPVNPSQDKPAEIIMESAIWGSDSTSFMGPLEQEGWEVDQIEGNFTYGKDGTWKEHFEAQHTNQVTYYTTDTTYFLDGKGNVTKGHFKDSLGLDYDFTTGLPSILIAKEEGKLNYKDPIGPNKWTKHSLVKMTLHTGGKAGSTKKHLFQLSATATEETAVLAFVPGDIPFNQIIVKKTLDTNGFAYAVLADNTSEPVTPIAGRQMYWFTGPGADKQCVPKILKFYDSPQRPLGWSYPANPAHWPWQWQASLQVVCDNGPISFSLVGSPMAYGFTMDTNGDVTDINTSGAGNLGEVNKIVVTSITPTNNTDPGGGIIINAYYIGCDCDSGSLNWIQTLTTNTVPQDTQTTPHRDSFPSYDPYYNGHGTAIDY